MVCLIYYWYLILMEEVQYLHLQCITTPHGKDVQYHPLGAAVGPIWYLIPSRWYLHFGHLILGDISGVHLYI